MFLTFSDKKAVWFKGFSLDKPLGCEAFYQNWNLIIFLEFSWKNDSVTCELVRSESSQKSNKYEFQFGKLKFLKFLEEVL